MPESQRGITIRKFGIDKAKGPYIEDTLFFDGVKGTYLLSGSASANGIKIKGATNDNKPKEFTLFEPKTTNLGKNHIFEMFSKPPKI